MSDELPIKIAKRAAKDIKEAGTWWATNRPKAPQAFIEEIERSFRLIASQPGIGTRARKTKLVGIRRILLARVHYHLYYRVTSDPPVVEVLALWHTSRRGVPPVQAFDFQT